MISLTFQIKAANIINAYVRGYLVRRMMITERVIALKNTYKEALHCMLKLHVDAPLNRSEFNFLHRLQLQVIGMRNFCRKIYHPFSMVAKSVRVKIFFYYSCECITKHTSYSVVLLFVLI